MKIRTLHDLTDLQNKTVLLRVDFNVPIEKNGDIKDDSRIVGSLETIKYLQEKGAKVVIISHLGRPDGAVKEELRLTKIAQHLAKLINKPVTKIDESVGTCVKNAIVKMSPCALLMLENIRFHKEEEECEANFTKELASLGEIFINDAFGTAHRKHASTAGLADYLPAYAGLLMEKEINALSPLLEEDSARPLTMIFGGAKIDTKIGIIKNFINKADYFLVGGALANTFLAAAGYNIGKSVYEEDKLDTAREIMLECEKHKERFILPHDVIVADEISETAQTLDLPIEDVIGEMKILDLGKHSAERFCEVIKNSGTVIWNGPLGLTEFAPFRQGTKTIAECLANHKCNSILGGGDTAEVIKTLNIPEEKFTHISTGGGAAIEFLSGEKLPGITTLLKN